MSNTNIYTLQKPIVFILRDKFDEFAKVKVDFYLDILRKDSEKYVLSMDHTIRFVEKKAIINITVDIVVYNTNLEPVKYIIIEQTKKNSKLFKQIIKHMYSASKFEGDKTIQHLAILNPKTKKLTCVNYKKYNSYKKWKRAGFVCETCV